jgi:hypothetical protein
MERDSAEIFAKRTRRRQVHIWLSDREYAWLRSVARDHDESLSGTIRRVLKSLYLAGCASEPQRRGGNVR